MRCARRVAARSSSARMRLHAGEAHALVGELLDAAQQRDVALGVAAAAAARARGLDQPLALVDAQRLRVHAGELGRDRDDVERPRVRILRRHRRFASGCGAVRTARRGGRRRARPRAPRPRRAARRSSSIGHLHVDGDEQVAAAPSPFVAAHALPADAQHLAARRARRDPHRDLAVERRHLHLARRARPPRT